MRASVLLPLTTAFLSLPIAALAQTVTLGGEGRMSVEHVRIGGGVFTQTWQSNELDLDFDVMIQADHGLRFGAYSQVQIQDGMTGIFSASQVWAESGNTRLTMGNADGAVIRAGYAFGYAGGCEIGHTATASCFDTFGLGMLQQFDATMPTPERARLDYAAGDFVASVSHERGGSELGVRYTWGATTVAAGYSTNGVRTVSAQYDAGVWRTGLNVTDVLGTVGTTVSGTYRVGMGEVYAFTGWWGSTGRAHGVSYRHDLGRGAQAMFGAQGIDGAVTFATAGVSFSF